jgi:hypothetical protein
MRPDFEIGGSGGIRGRRRPGGDTQSLPRCHEAARRTQRRRLVRLAPAQRPLGGWQGRERLAGLEASSVALDVAAMS